ncbi:protease modulator HflC [Desulfovibrio inopinatus]|uniref:protease modulator HflC n=1 Tax=Desulfovibrio inopinatus TaxID=102109 RepID=UPI000409D595|nr:protease modulator HflC [Desulfovibrio inopinatus]
MSIFKSSSVLLLIVLAAIVLITQSVFTVDQTQRAIVLQLGKPVGGARGPGLHFKLPFVQNVIYMDSRILDYDAKAAEILTKDKKTMVVDNYARWQITKPLDFYTTLRTVSRAQARLEDIIYAELRVALGQFTLAQIVSSKRAEIMELVTEKSNAALTPFGIEIVDVRIKRTDLPPENQNAIFGRMRAERERQAKLYRSEGREEMAKIKSSADKERAVLLAEAGRKSEILRGEGDAQAAAIYAEAYNKDKEFYAFTKSLDAYKKSFRDNAKMVLTPSSEFFEYMH